MKLVKKSESVNKHYENEVCVESITGVSYVLVDDNEMQCGQVDVRTGGYTINCNRHGDINVFIAEVESMFNPQIKTV